MILSCSAFDVAIRMIEHAHPANDVLENPNLRMRNLVACRDVLYALKKMIFELMLDRHHRRAARTK